jgi:hypothetical protein
MLLAEEARPGRACCRASDRSCAEGSNERLLALEGTGEIRAGLESAPSLAVMKMLQEFAERLLIWTVIVVIGAIVLIILQLLGYA